MPRNNPWSLQSYPYPDPDFEFDEDTELATSQERLFWRESKALAYGAGKPHPVDQEPMLVTWEELTRPSDTLPTEKERRQRR
jgi:hypothetical protein